MRARLRRGTRGLTLSCLANEAVIHVADFGPSSAAQCGRRPDTYAAQTLGHI